MGISDTSATAVPMPAVTINAGPSHRDMIAERLRLVVSDAGGELRTSQRSLSKAVNSSTPTVNGVLAALVATGTIA